MKAKTVCPFSLIVMLFIVRLILKLKDIIHVSGGSSGDALTFFAGMCVICDTLEEGGQEVSPSSFGIKRCVQALLFLFLLPGKGQQHRP